MEEFGASGRHAVLRGAGVGGSPARVADSSDPQARRWSCAWIPPPPFWLGHRVALTLESCRPQTARTNTEGKAPFLHPDLPNWPRRGAPGSPVPTHGHRSPRWENEGFACPRPDRFTFRPGGQAGSPGSLCCPREHIDFYF